AMELMRSVALAQRRVLQDPEPSVHIKGFGENGIDLDLSLWIGDPEEGSSSLKSEIFLNIWRSFQQHSIAIPFPQREIRILAGQTSQ
ncbi:MAG TPA: mechanosensitive ion channel protein MscS, partial [Methylophilaceae bacterium]|nr:mechanosensitive ion channel protein MscS [Methylophilaceae bacterium]